MDFEERAQSFFDWIQLHGRQIAIGAAIAAAAAVGGWLYVRGEATKEQRAYESLARASEAVAAQNWALAQSDLERVVTRYGKTPSGQQAALLLAEVLYNTGKVQQGIDQLQKVLPSADADVVPTIEAQIAAGYEQLGKFDDAAAHYRRASEASRFETQRDLHMADAARSLTAGGKTADAKRIWTDLAAKEASAVSGEARVRLGELEAAAAKAP